MARDLPSKSAENQQDILQNLETTLAGPLSLVACQHRVPVKSMSEPGRRGKNSRGQVGNPY